MDFIRPPSRRPTMMKTNHALGDNTASTACSQNTDVDMSDTDGIDYSEDAMSFDTPVRRSIEKDDDDVTSLRGGVLAPPPNLAWAKQVAVTSRYDQGSYSGDREEARDDDSYSSSSDWDNYGSLSMILREYEETVARLEGSEDWNADQRKLHKLIYMRGLHPMMPSWWRMNFKMWGITQPHLDDVFTPKHSNKGVAIFAFGNEVAAAKALESLFYLSQTVADYEEIGYQSKIAPTVVKGIKGYIKWALRDAQLDKDSALLNMLVRAYPPDFRGDDDHESEGSEFAPSPVSDEGKQSGKNDGDDEDDDATEGQRAMRFTRAVSRDLEKRLLDLAQRWRELVRDQRCGRWEEEPPTLYAFAVIQHVVMLASHDPMSPLNPVVVLEQVSLNDRGQWLWNALSIALPISMARDALYYLRWMGVNVREHVEPETDPDM